MSKSHDSHMTDPQDSYGNNNVGASEDPSSQSTNRSSPKEVWSPSEQGGVASPSPQGKEGMADSEEALQRHAAPEPSVEEVVSKWRKLLGPNYDVFVSVKSIHLAESLQQAQNSD